MLTQVSKFEWLQRDFDGAGVFWMEDNGMTVHMRLRGEVHPNDTCIEITTREQVFSPFDRYQNYIKVSGLHLRRAANPVPIPWPQRGMLSTFGGHHWIVEDCELGYANTVALDMGGGWWDYGTGECQGYNIIRRNHMRDGVLVDPRMEWSFGSVEKVDESDSDVIWKGKQQKAAGVELPNFYLTCGTEDFCWDFNINLRDAFRDAGIELTWDERPGAHTWSFWDAAVQRFIDWLPLKNKPVIEEGN